VNACEVNVLKASSTSKIIIRRKPGTNSTAGLLQFANRTIECRLGKGGIATRKREGDGATPTGSFKILFGYFRKERLAKPVTPLNLAPTAETDGWCDDVTSPNYNKPVTLPFSRSHETMIRQDRLYDICLVLDYNIHPVIRGGGSAIFFHLTGEKRNPTLGCVAIDPDDMRRLLPLLNHNTHVEIQP